MNLSNGAWIAIVVVGGLLVGSLLGIVGVMSEGDTEYEALAIAGLGGALAGLGFWNFGRYTEATA